MSFMPSKTDDFLYQEENQNGNTYIHTCKPIYVSVKIHERIYAIKHPIHTPIMVFIRRIILLFIISPSFNYDKDSIVNPSSINFRAYLSFHF